MDIYTYGFKGTVLKETLLTGNGMYDPGVNAISYYFLTNLSTQNKIICGTSPVSKTFLTGDAASINSTTIICSESGMLDSSGNGIAPSEFAYGVVVKGTYTPGNLYPGPFTVSSQFTPTQRVSIGYDGTGGNGIIDCKNNTTPVPCKFNASVVQVPNTAGASSTVAGGILYDTTNKNFHAGSNSVDNIIPLLPSASIPTTGNFVKWLVSGNIVTLQDGGGSVGNPANYLTSTNFTGIGPTTFTPTHTLDVFDNTSSTGNTWLYARAGAGQSTDIFTTQYTTSANDIWSVNTSGTLYGRTNSPGILFQLVTADASYRTTSAGCLKWNSTTTLATGALDTGLCRNVAGVLEVNNGTPGTFRDFKYRTGNQTGLTALYNNIATVGWGIPAIYGTGRVTGQVAASSSIATYTVGVADGTFLVSGNVNVTAATTASFTMTVTYTDETNVSRTLTLNFSNVTGTLLTTITNVTGTGAYEGVPLHIRCKASTAITFATIGTFTSVTYNAEGFITQIG